MSANPARARPMEIAGLNRRAAHGWAALALRYGLALLLNLAGTVVLSRLLGPELWGVWAVAQVVYLSCQEILGRGLSTYLIRKSEQPSPAEVRSTFALQHLLGMAIGLAVAAGARPVAGWYGREPLTGLLLATAAASYFYAWRAVPAALLERDFRYGSIALLELSDCLIFNTAAILLAWHGHAILGLAAALLLRGLLPTVLVYCLQPVQPALFPSPGLSGGIADFGFALAGSSLVNVTILSVPALFVGKLAGMVQLGLAQMAFALYSNLLFVTGITLRLNLSFYSRLTEHPGELAARVNQHLAILAAGLAPLIVAFTGLAPAWSRTLLGERWQGLPLVLLSQAPGYLSASVFWGVLNPALTVSGKHRQVLFWLLGFAASYALLTRTLAPRWGAVGMGAAFSAVELAGLPLLAWMYTRAHARLEIGPVLFDIALGGGFTALLWMSSNLSPRLGAGGLMLYLSLWVARRRRILARVPDWISLTWRRSARGPSSVRVQ